jgi:hypothetical protein
MTHETTVQTPEIRQTPARPYHVPHLLVYGAMRELTAGGSGQAAENSQQMEITRRQ